MFISRNSPLLGAVVVVVAVSCMIGCGSTPGAGQGRFIPTTSKARDAVESAMQAWQRGEPLGPVKDTHPTVFVADAHRREGQTLESYDILGEVPGDTPRCFLVKVKLAHPEAEKKIRYAVIGIDPLWVFHHDDLEMLTRWEHPMPTSSGNKEATSTTETRSIGEIPTEATR